ncbi:MAG: hypothetical protein Q8K79_03975 [Solirubrobacteraceae bacterium]|nr:hypothetical protein [Solirubrobacteraceae bacterium]
MSGSDRISTVVDRDELLASIAAQRCPWCGRQGLRSLANHTVRAHQIYADELRELAGLPTDAPLCSSDLSERHRQLTREQDPTQWLHRPEVLRRRPLPARHSTTRNNAGGASNTSTACDQTPSKRRGGGCRQRSKTPSATPLTS